MKSIRIAFLTSMLTNTLSQQIYFGIKNQIKGKDIILHTFTGGSLTKEFNQWIDITSNTIYELPDNNNYDALIIYGGSIGQYVDKKEMSLFCHRYRDIPIVNISYDLPKIPTVSVSNFDGIYSICEHLIKKHNYKDIAFIEGPEDHCEAIDRLRGYKEALKDNNILLRESLIIKGDFSRQSGVDGVRYLLDDINLKPDCIVCVDDDTALGAVDELKNRGLTVPDDVAVTGFDDSDIASSINPALTTVNQPFYELGVKAVQTLMEIINGVNVSDNIIIKSLPVYRDSCGCIETIVKTKLITNGDVSIPAESDKEKTINALYNKFRNKLKIDYKLIKELVDSFCMTLRHKDDIGFYKVFNKLMFLQEDKGNCFIDLNDFLSYFYKIISNNFLENVNDVNNIFVEARAKNFHKLHRKDIIKRINVESRYFFLNQINQVLHQSNSLEELFNLTYRHLKTLMVNSFFVILYKDINNRSKGGNLTYGFNSNGIIELPEGGININHGEILPQKFRSELSNNTILLSLSFTGEAMGYIVMEMEETLANLSPTICWHYSSTLKRIFIQMEKDKKAKELEIALSDLKETQKKLIESEKISHLASLVSRVSHELNTPLGITISYLSVIEESTKKIIDNLEHGELKRSNLKSELNLIDQSSTKALQTVKGTSHKLKNFKKIAALSSDSDIKTFNLKEYLISSISIIENSNKEYKNRIILICPDNIKIIGDPGSIYQVFSGLVDNSIRHGFTDKMLGNIKIEVTEVEGNALIIYSDNGCGINKNEFSKVFEPFYTTRRVDGCLGLGLNTVFNTVVKLLHGSIEVVESKTGARFQISIPISSSSLELSM